MPRGFCFLSLAVIKLLGLLVSKSPACSTKCSGLICPHFDEIPKINSEKRY